jgi:myo-inositol-1(or 4)-monophosphatase
LHLLRKRMIETRVSDHTKSLSDSLFLAIRAADAAGRFVIDGYGKLNAFQQKDAGDLVSQVDFDADRAATAILSAESDLPILSEELNHAPDSLEDLWIVDPLDGSSAYLMQAGPQYPAVLVAQREQSETVLGVAYFPLTNDWFYAQRGRGAWRNGKRLLCESDESLGDVWVEMNQYGNARWESSYFTSLGKRLRSTGGAQLVTTSAPNSGVAMRIATCENPLAIAIHDNGPEHVKQGPWDIAAPQLILEEAGGVFVNPNGERTDPFVAEPIIVARSVSLARSILDLNLQSTAAG